MEKTFFIKKFLVIFDQMYTAKKSYHTIFAIHCKEKSNYQIFKIYQKIWQKIAISAKKAKFWPIFLSKFKKFGNKIFFFAMYSFFLQRITYNFRNWKMYFNFSSRRTCFFKITHIVHINLFLEKNSYYLLSRERE